MKIPKDRREVRIAIQPSDLEGPLEGLEMRLKGRIQGECQNAEITCGWDYDSWEIVGTRAATEKELERSAKAATRMRELAARKKEAAKAAELEEYERLRRKYS